MIKTIRKAMLKWQIQGYTNRKRRIQGRMNVYYYEVYNITNTIDVLKSRLKRIG